MWSILMGRNNGRSLKWWYPFQSLPKSIFYKNNFATTHCLVLVMALSFFKFSCVRLSQLILQILSPTRSPFSWFWWFHYLFIFYRIKLKRQQNFKSIGSQFFCLNLLHELVLIIAYVTVWHHHYCHAMLSVLVFNMYFLIKKPNKHFRSLENGNNENTPLPQSSEAMTSSQQTYGLLLRGVVYSNIFCWVELCINPFILLQKLSNFVPFFLEPIFSLFLLFWILLFM